MFALALVGSETCPNSSSSGLSRSLPNTQSLVTATSAFASCPVSKYALGSRSHTTSTSDRNTFSPASNSFASEAVLASPSRLNPTPLCLHPVSATTPAAPSSIADLSMLSDASMRSTPLSSHHRTVCASMAMTSTFRMSTRRACSSQFIRKSRISTVAKQAVTVSPTAYLLSESSASNLCDATRPTPATIGVGSGWTVSASSSSSSPSSSSSVRTRSPRICVSSESPSPLLRLASKPVHVDVLSPDLFTPSPAPLGGLSSASHRALSSVGSGKVGADLLIRCGLMASPASSFRSNHRSGWNNDNPLALSTKCSRARGKTSLKRTLTPGLRRLRAMVAPAVPRTLETSRSLFRNTCTSPKWSAHSWSAEPEVATRT